MKFNELKNNPVYVISLSKDIDRYAWCKPALNKIGFNKVIRYSGLDANVHRGEDEANGLNHYDVSLWEKSKTYKLSKDTMAELGLDWSKKYVYDHKPYNPFTGGQLGCAVSHYKCIKEAYDRGDHYVFVFEDDVRPHQCFNDFAEELWDNTPTDWEILYMNIAAEDDTINEVSERNVVYACKNDPRYRVVQQATFGQQSYILTRIGMKRYLDYVKEKRIFCIDIDIIDLTRHHGMKAYQWLTTERADFDTMPSTEYSLMCQMNGNLNNHWGIPLSIHCHRQKNPFLQLQGWCCEEKQEDLFHYIDLYNCKKGLEIGVFGGSSFIRAGMMFKANGGQITGIDPYCAEDSNRYDEEGANKEWWKTVDYEKIKVGCLLAIQTFGLKRVCDLLVTNSDDYCNKVEDNSLDFIHIDGNHTEIQSTLDCEMYLPKLKVGGILVMDDIEWESVRKARQWLNEHCKMLVERNINGNSWGVYEKIDCWKLEN